LKRTIISFGGILGIIGQSAPQLFIAIFLISLILGFLPIISAWILKLIFDVAGSAIASEMLGEIWRGLIQLLPLFLVSSMASPLFEEVNSYLR
jgi:hypothetical protein